MYTLGDFIDRLRKSHDAALGHNTHKTALRDADLHLLISIKFKIEH